MRSTRRQRSQVRKDVGCKSSTGCEAGTEGCAHTTRIRDRIRWQTKRPGGRACGRTGWLAGRYCLHLTYTRLVDTYRWDRQMDAGGWGGYERMGLVWAWAWAVGAGARLSGTPQGQQHSQTGRKVCLIKPAGAHYLVDLPSTQYQRSSRYLPRRASCQLPLRPLASPPSPLPRRAPSLQPGSGQVDLGLPGMGLRAQRRRRALVGSVWL